MYSYLERGYHFRREVDLQVAAITPSSALPWEAEMLCRLASGDHDALCVSSDLPWEAEMLCMLASGDHDALCVRELGKLKCFAA